MCKRSVTTIKPGYWTTERTWYGQMTLGPLCSSLHWRSLHLENPCGRKAKVLNVSFQQGSFEGSSSSIMDGILFITLLPFMTEQLQGCTWTGSEIRWIPWSSYSEQLCSFPRKHVPVLQVELFSNGLKRTWSLADIITEPFWIVLVSDEQIPTSSINLATWKWPSRIIV
jgi:hypothetical protein